jgi:hypothetical protein
MNGKHQSKLSIEAPIFIPIDQRNAKNLKPPTFLDPSWIIRSHSKYQISERSICDAIRDKSWGLQTYMWFDASSVRCLQLANQEESCVYILSQRKFYEKNKIRFNRKSSAMYQIGILSGYLRDDKSEVSVHESGIFSVPYYFKGISGGLLQIGNVVPRSKLMEMHKLPENQIKAHNDQDLHFLSYINASEFKSIIVATKLAAHQLYMKQGGIHRYSRPKWNVTTFKNQHYATLHYEASFEDIINALKVVLVDSYGRYNKIRYLNIISECTIKPKFDHFDLNEVELWRNDRCYNHHSHKFPLDIEKLEKYETLAYLNHQRILGVNVVDKKTFEDFAKYHSLHSNLVLDNHKL